jgi:riboflavin synthase
MFTGLVETTGAITSLKNTGKGIRLSLRPSAALDVQTGDSICVNGVCLTVTTHGADIDFDVSPETMKSTNLGEQRMGGRVNLERALRLSDRLGGHIVTGHVDDTGSVVSRKPVGDYTFFTFESSDDILKYIVKKGSVAIDGISLTVVELDSRSFSVAIIPHTLSATNLAGKETGDKVNIEVDIIGKYVEKLLGRKDPGPGLMELLKEEGFVNEQEAE